MDRCKKYVGKVVPVFKRRTFQFYFRKYYFFILACCVFLAFVFYRFLLLPQIYLNGSKKVILNYKEKYVEKGYHASFSGGDITDSVVVSGRVNSEKLGIYHITYSVKNGIFSNRVSRTVIVKDISAPTIHLESEGDIYVCPGKEYVVEKYRAKDNYDGDLTDQVKVKKNRDFVVYSVSDQAKNKKEIRRKIIYEDHEKPQLVLTGSSTVYTFLGENYDEKGYQASDNCSGDLTDRVKVSGKVNSNQLGEYLLTYSVSDDSSNSVEVTRKVVVCEHGRKGTIYLTFDDGPKKGTTDVILDILKEEGVFATFFVTNGGPDELIKRAYDEGHSIGLHTASHDYSIVYSSVDQYFEDLNTVSNRVLMITGVESKIIRFPGGSSNTISRRYSPGIMSILTREVLNRGYKYYDWNLSSTDAEGGNHTASQIYDSVVSKLSKDRINMVLMHDIKPYTRDALKDIIHYGKEHGYVFEKITMNTEMVTQRVNN